MTVTEIQGLRGGKFKVCFSDGTELKAGLELITDFSLYKGRVLSEEEYGGMMDASRLSDCKNRALRLIGRRPMSCRELYDKLAEKGESPANAETSVNWLLKLHYLDDMQYAGMLVRHYAAKGYGRKKIQNELYNRGIPKDLWDEAFSEMPDTAETVYKLLRRRLNSPEPDRNEIKKATDSLYRRGFSWDEIKAALNRFESESED